MQTEKRKPVVLITGASAGLGLSVAKLLLSQSYQVILTARASSLPRFETLGIRENESIWIRPLDVTSAVERSRLIEEVNKHLGGVDILINNAGFSYRAVLEHVEKDEYRRQMLTNFEGPMDLCRLVLPSMRKKRSGRIINISSVGGMMAMPTMAPYSASKFALEGATESLWYEVKPWNIFVTLVQPGFINSDSFLKVRYTELAQSSFDNKSDPYHAHYRYMSQFIARFMRLSPTQHSTVAKHILSIMNHSNPPLRAAASFDAHLFSWIRRLLPRRIYHWLLYRLLPGINEWGRL